MVEEIQGLLEFLAYEVRRILWDLELLDRIPFNICISAVCSWQEIQGLLEFLAYEVGGALWDLALLIY